MLYWTDRGDLPRGNTVNRAPMDPSPGIQTEPEILISHLKGNRMFVTDLAGSVYRANLDGSNRKVLLVALGNLPGLPIWN